MQQVIAKFKVEQISHRAHSPEDPGTAEVEMTAVCTDDPESKYYSFAQATPAGSIRLFIDNPNAIPLFKAGHVYDITIAKENVGDGPADEAPEA